jgi:hypothetical protein
MTQTAQLFEKFNRVGIWGSWKAGRQQDPEDYES